MQRIMDSRLLFSTLIGLSALGCACSSMALAQFDSDLPVVLEAAAPEIAQDPADRVPGGVAGEATSEFGGQELVAPKDAALAPIQTRKMNNKISTVTTSMAGIGTGLIPGSEAEQEAAISLPSGFQRGAAFQCVHWQPSLICHGPLYFEDAMLERHGHRRNGCLQPLASGVKFFSTIPLMPYLHTLRPTREHHYALGTYRPGSCAPMLHDSLPYDKHAAVVETLSLATIFWAAPL